MHLPQDFADLLAAFAAYEVRYLVVGGYAVGVHDRPRTTKDLDILLEPSTENIQNACLALDDFGAPKSIIDHLRSVKDDEVVWWGSPPLRIDILTAIPGVEFATAYSRRMPVRFGETTGQVIGLDDLIEAKRAAGRPQDLVDAERLVRRKAQQTPA
jgi:hypothetical protein